jgi:hypothetical protein
VVLWVQVSATMRPDREDPFVRAGKLRMQVRHTIVLLGLWRRQVWLRHVCMRLCVRGPSQQVYRRRKRKLSEALVRNLSSCIDLMTHQANVEFNRVGGDGWSYTHSGTA